MREQLISLLIVSQVVTDKISRKADRTLESDKFLLGLISLAVLLGISLALFNPTP